MAARKNIFRRPGVRVGLAISILMITLAGVVLLFWLATRSLFSKSSHFTLKYVDVRSTGWWKSRDAEVIKILGITPGITNLFELKLPELRKILEKQPGIEQVTMARILPDILQINIIERIPRAFLFQPESSWVVDSSGVLMISSSCVNLKRDLPYITGFSYDDNLRPGHDLPQVKPALALINLAAVRYPEIRIVRVSLNNPQELNAVFYTPGVPNKFYLQMPRGKLEKKMELLKSVLTDIYNRKDTRRKIVLLFDGKVVLN